MMPIFMGSYPYQNNHIPPHYYSSHDNLPLHMMRDHTKSPATYECWPHDINYGYPLPYHGCCSHSHVPGFYGFGPTFSNFSPAPAFHSYRHHPSFPEPSYPIHHVPPMHHGMDQQRYENDKGAHSGFHCCGCPNHMSNQKLDKGVKIEEQEPDVVRKSPIQSKSYPYPVVWIPPEYIKKNDQQSRHAEVADQEKIPYNTMSPEIKKLSEAKPKEWNCWYPLDMNSLKSLMDRDENTKQDQQDENGVRHLIQPITRAPSKNEGMEENKDQIKGNSWLPLNLNSLRSLMQGEGDESKENQQNGDKMCQPPCPVFFIPFQTEQGQYEKDGKEMNDALTSAQESSGDSKFVQVKPPESDTVKYSKASTDILGDQAKGSQMMEGTAKKKIIPVKQVEAHREGNSDSTEKKVVAGNSSETTKKRPSLSPPKTSNLPPVCLRLEPLSKKKNCVGKSRSPSPPCLKRQSEEATSELSASSSSKEHMPQGEESADISVKTRDMDPKDAEREAVNMVHVIKTRENEIEHLESGEHMKNFSKLSIGPEEDVNGGKSSLEINGKGNDQCDFIQDNGVRCEIKMAAEGETEENEVTNSAVSVTGEWKSKKKNLSDDQAAVLIQSAFRGFEVRKFEPLKKLRQLAEVSHEAAEIRKRIEALESSNLQKIDKETMVIGEMIMRLLLKLDTIQGLYPDLRDVRKRLAKDLVTLQEDLDSLMMKSKEVTAAKVAEDIVSVEQGGTGKQEIENKTLAVLENSSVTCPDNAAGLTELDHSTADHAVSSQVVETSDPTLGDLVMQGTCEHEVRELVVKNDTSCSGADAFKAELTERPEEDVLCPLFQQTSSEKVIGAQLQDSCDDPKFVIEAKLDRLDPAISVKENLELIDEEPPVAALEKDGSTGERKREIAGGELKSLSVAGLTLASEGDNPEKALETSNVDPKINVAAEMPTGSLVEVDLAVQSEENGADPEKLGELPGVLTEDQANKNKENDADWETSLVAELPVGVLEEDSMVNYEDCETHKDEAFSSGAEKYNGASNTTRQLLEDVVNIMSKEVPANVVLGPDEEPPSSPVEKVVGSDDEGTYRSVAIGRVSSPESKVVHLYSQESEETKEDDTHQVAKGNMEEMVEEKSDMDKSDEANESEITREDVLADTPKSQVSSLDESDGVAGGDRKLIEENANLREMVERLMEAGKEQLTVISQLSGRVKDLERKLPRRKKIRTPRRKRRATSTFR